MRAFFRAIYRSPRAMVALAAAFVLLLGITGGTLAIIRAYSAPVENVFSINGIHIELYETETDDGDDSPFTNSYRMMPGQAIGKDPAVSVEGGSMACWLFVKLNVSNNFDQFLTYELQDGWNALDGEDKVYYRQVEAQDAPQVFGLFRENQVMVKEEVTLEMLRALTQENFPTLTLTAYAVQMEGVGSVEEAWQLAPTQE